MASAAVSSFVVIDYAAWRPPPSGGGNDAAPSLQGCHNLIRQCDTWPDACSGRTSTAGTPDRTPVVGPSAMRVRVGWRSRLGRTGLGRGSPGRCGVGRCCTRSSSPPPARAPPAGCRTPRRRAARRAAAHRRIRRTGSARASRARRSWSPHQLNRHQSRRALAVSPGPLSQRTNRGAVPRSATSRSRTATVASASMRRSTWMVRASRVCSSTTLSSLRILPSVVWSNW